MGGKTKQPPHKCDGCFEYVIKVPLKKLAPVVFNGCLFTQALKPV